MNLHHRHRTLWAIAALGLVACGNEGNLTDFDFTNVTVTAGDFDDIGSPLNRMGVPYELADGIISTATWDPELEHERLALKVEDLLGLPGELGANQAVLVASGTRGLGKRQYNGLDPDDQLVSDPVIAENLQGYVEFGGVLVVSDWAYDLVEAAWPDAVDWVNDDAEYDDAQRGLSGDLTARVVNDDVADALGGDTVAIRFDFTNWAVIDSVSDRVDVLIEGDVDWQPDATADAESKTGAPLMFSFQPRGARGKVVYTSFHIDAQNPPMMDALMEAAVGHFQAAGPTTVSTE